MGQHSNKEWFKIAKQMMKGELEIKPEVIEELCRVDDLLEKTGKKLNSPEVIASIISRFIKKI